MGVAEGAGQVCMVHDCMEAILVWQRLHRLSVLGPVLGVDDAKSFEQVLQQRRTTLSGIY